MSRAGRRFRPSEPERRCIASRRALPKSALIRFAVSPEGIMTPDIEEKLPGRGYWVRSDRPSLEAAERKNLFRRAAGPAVTVPAGLAALVDALLAAHVCSLLALARKSGHAVAGFEKAREAIQAGSAGLLLQAIDGSPRQRAKLNRCVSAPDVHACMTGHEIGLAFARASVIHAAVQRGRLAAGMSRELRRLACLRGIPEPGGNFSLEPAMS